MDDKADARVERWILTFCEMPPLVDVDLVKRILADHEARKGHRPEGRS